MAYKDKARQRQAVRDATRRYRRRVQGITRVSDTVIPVIPKPVIPEKPYVGPLTKDRQTAKKGFNE